jgi:hypothetical protein
MDCFQHITGSCGALHNPRRGAPQQRGPLTSDSTTRPNWLHTHTHSPKRLAYPRSPIPPLSTLTARAALEPPFYPAALASVPSGIVIVRVRVRRHVAAPAALWAAWDECTCAGAALLAILSLNCGFLPRSCCVFAHSTFLSVLGSLLSRLGALPDG